jgi:hypothetical protein
MPQDSERPQKLIADSVTKAFIRVTGKPKKAFVASEPEVIPIAIEVEPQPKSNPDEGIPLPKLPGKSTTSVLRTTDESPLLPLPRKNSELSHTKLMNRLKNKTKKIKMYWNKLSPVIPNVFKMNQFTREDAREVVEFNDLSLKSILVMAALPKGNRAIACGEAEETFNSGSENFRFGDLNQNEEDEDFADLDFQFKLN